MKQKITNQSIPDTGCRMPVKREMLDFEFAEDPEGI